MHRLAAALPAALILFGARIGCHRSRRLRRFRASPSVGVGLLVVGLTFAISDSAAARGLAAPPPAPAPVVSAERPGRLIAFVRYVANRPELFTVRSNGHEVHQLTQHGIGDFAWGPGGRHLLYSTAHGIWIMRWDGSDRRRLTGSGHPRASEPLWSPDGSKFLFFANHGGTDQLWVYRFAGHRFTSVDQPAVHYAGASWSPNSQQLVFSAFDEQTGRYQLWSDTLATGTVQQLTSFRRGEQGSGAEYPAWSPGGGRIVFVLEAVRCQTECIETNLWSVAPDGTDLHQITFSPRHGEHQAAWAPHGKRFVDASSTDVNYDLPSDYTALVVRRPDGTTIRRIHAPGDESANWSPNGSWIVAVRPGWGATLYDYAKKPGLWVMRADGTDAHRVLKTRFGKEGIAAFPAAAWEPRPR